MHIQFVQLHIGPVLFYIKPEMEINQTVFHASVLLLLVGTSYTENNYFVI
jgi:hypothetical protein